MAVPILAGMVLAAGCAYGPASVRPAAPRILRHVALAEPPADPRPYGAADTSFGLDLLDAWCRQDPDANIVFSPESLATGLSLAYLGARGGTAQAMAAVLHLPAAGRALIAGLHARSAALQALDRPGVTLAASDQLWADPALPTRPGYLTALASSDGAGVRQVPLLSHPATAAQQIDAEVAAATRGHIPHLLTPEQLRDSRSGWVLTDALYLDAQWATPFQASQTAPGAFTTAAGRQVTARFLHGGSLPAAAAGGWTAVSLPYRGGQLAMTALLPDSGTRGCPALTVATVRTITAALARGGASRRAAVALPKVSLRSSASLPNLLSKLGMGVAFTPAADFHGLSPAACCIGTVVHAATLDVAERGTVGSAATAVTIQPAVGVARPPSSVTFNRPYLLLVTDTSTGEPLFLARVADPAA